MDDVVYSAPNIQERIPGGRAQITGQFTTSEATELEILLNSPTLDAPIIPVSSSIIGASLGADSIKSGITAGIIGLLAVMIFMLIYYKGAGLVADFVLVFNIGFILAMLTLFKATLTLPGIAGIILTIGMAVDANVVIFERIKEELDAGKTPRTAVDAGYSRATVTVWDSNITTLIAAAVLYYIGSGPIRGFAVTLTIGIIGSMFCAIVFARTIFDNLFLKSNKETMSI
jgi:preprotein translocase subunit SecD